MSMAQPPDAPGEAVAGEATCYHCETALPPEAELCPECGRKQYRVCYCAARIRPDLATCPHCQADWSESSRVRRTRRKGRHQGTLRGIIRSAVIGGLLSLLVIGFLYYLTGSLAQHASGTGEAPTDLTTRVAYAWKAIALNADRLAHRVASVLSSRQLWRLGSVFLAGAALGAAVYLAQHGRWTMNKLGGGRRTRRRRTE
jgi:hypothetical protein